MVENRIVFNFLGNIEWDSDENVMEEKNGSIMHSIVYKKFEEPRRSKYGEKSFRRWYNENEEDLQSMYENFIIFIEENDGKYFGIFDGINFNNFCIFMYNYVEE